MKKFINILCCLLIAACLTFTLAGCGGGETADNYINVTINEMNGNPTSIVRVQKGAVVPKTGFGGWPTRAEWFFDACYLDEECTTLAEGYIINKAITLYAGYKDSKVINTYDSYPDPYHTLFNVDLSLSYNSSTGVFNLTGNIAPYGDMTGELTSDNLHITYWFQWLSDEMFLDKYVSDEIVGWAAFGIDLQKSNNFTMNNINVSFNRYNTETTNITAALSNIYSNEGYVSSRAPKTFINAITTKDSEGFSTQATIQYNHNK